MEEDEAGSVGAPTGDQAKPGVYRVDGSGQATPIPPGAYRVGPDGQLQAAVDWQPMLAQVKWDEVTGLVENWQKRGSSERKIDLYGMYALVAIVVVAAAILGGLGIIGGEAIAGFLGAAIGYLLSRASGGDS